MTANKLLWNLQQINYCEIDSEEIIVKLTANKLLSNLQWRILQAMPAKKKQFSSVTMTTFIKNL